jgi:YVTN family beta-propeller protein
VVRRTKVSIDWGAGICFALCLLATRAAAVIPPVAAGFPNVPQTPGAILSGLNAPQQGRTAIIAYQDGVLFTVPEVPSSQPGADFQVRTWDIRDPTRPIELARWGVTPMPINAHGYFHSGPYLVLGANWPPGGEWSFRVSPARAVTRTSFPDLTCAGARGCLFGPWYINDTYWSYGAVGGDAEIWFDWNLLSSWDHLGTTGVIGHPFLIGDLLIFASDQSRTGVATYDVSDPRHPVLLDVLTTGGPGGYFPELWGGDGKLYIVFPYQTEGNGFRVVDATDPANLRFVTDRALPGAASMYIQFQDEFAFMGGHKVDMRSFESVLQLNGENVARPNQPGQTGIDTSQFLLPLGNLLVTGGIGENEGMAIWAHQAEPDTRGPSVGFHIPQAGRTHYPLGAPISLLIHETLATATIVNGESFIVRRLGGTPLAGRITFSFDDVLTFQPNAPLQANTTYEVVIPAGGIKDVAGNGIAGYSFTFSTGATVGGNAPPQVTAFAASPYPAAPGASVTLTANATDPNGDALEYRFDLGDGSPKTAWSTLRSVGATYAAAGHYRATVLVRDPSGSLASESTVATVVAPPAATRPTNSSQIVCDAARRRVWSVNPDSDTVTALNADTLAVEREIPACADPRGVALAASGELWVTCHDEDRVVGLAADGTPLASVATGYGSAPAGIAASPDGATMYVALQGAGALARLSVATRQQTGRMALGPRPRAVAVSADGARVLVTRFLSAADRGEVWDVNATTFTLARMLAIPKFGNDANRDSTASGRGVAHYLVGIAIAPDGRSAWVAANKPNNERGLLVATDLDQDNTVRNVVVQLDLTTNTVVRAVDIDNSDSASALAFSPFGDYLLVTLQGNNELLVLDTLALEDAAGLGGFVTRLAAGRAPQGVCVDAQSERTLVANLLSRDVTALETAPLFRDGVVSVASSSVPTVSAERLAPTVLAGKRIFYDAGDRRMSAEGYMSCATCHLDGGHDGRTWDFTGRGEGLRNTATLHGRGGTAHGNVHWTANFDEIQDFEHDIRNAFGGSGFLSASDFGAAGTPLGAAKAGRSPDLDALAAYVASLGPASVPRSPYRNADGSMTAEAATGQALFASLACANCHAGTRLTDSTGPAATLHDVGTLRTTSGQRLGGPLTGIDTPTLLGVWDTPPYFHDGSAATLDDVFRVVGGTVIQAESGAVANGAEVVTDWVENNNDDTVRGRRYVALGSQHARVTFSNVNGGPGGNGAIEVRYSSGYGVFNLTLNVNGVTRTASLPLLGNDPGWRHVNWGRVRFEDVPLNAGASNTVALSSTSQFPNISIDEIVVGTAANVAAAAPHRAALTLSTGDRNALVAYLRQLDGNPPQGPQPTLSPTATRTPTATAVITATPGSATATPTSLPARHPLGGVVRHAGTNTAVSGATLMLRGTLDDEQSSGTGGDYVFRDLPAGAYTITAQRLGVGANVTSTDAQRALQASVGLQAPTGLQRLACDVTGDGRVTALDAARIVQFLSGRFSRFPAALACQSDWLFTPAPGVAGAAPIIQSGLCTPGVITVPSLSAPAAAADFRAAAIGDCNLAP